MEKRNVGTQTEDQLQSALFQKVWNEIPELRHHFWAIPNGLKLTPIEAVKAKATGLLSGVWDIHCYWKGQFYIIETKIGNNQLTKDRVVNGKKVYGQFEWGERMADHGAIRFVYRTIEEGFGFFNKLVKNI